MVDIWQGSKYASESKSGGQTPIQNQHKHCVKIAQIESLSGPYLVQMRENTDQKNSILIIFMQSKTLQQRL